MLFIRYDGGTEGHHEAPYASQPAINRKRGLDRPPKNGRSLSASPPSPSLGAPLDASDKKAKAQR